MEKCQKKNIEGPIQQNRPIIKVLIYCFGDFLPSFLQTENSTICESRTYLQHPITIKKRDKSVSCKSHLRIHPIKAHKLCRQRQMSATAVHFSIIAMREAKFGRRMISDATRRDTYS